LLDRRNEGAQHVDVVERPRESGSQVEAEPVDVHLLHPVAQGVHDHLQHVGIRHVEGVSAPGVVGVVPAIAQPVVARVADAAEGQRGAELVALGGVVVDDVEDDLEASLVKGAHHLLELAHLATAAPDRAVGSMRSEKAQGVVAPVVGEAELE